jgi:hypothetical protein
VKENTETLPDLQEALDALEMAAEQVWQAEDRFKKLLATFDLS